MRAIRYYAPGCDAVLSLLRGRERRAGGGCSCARVEWFAAVCPHDLTHSLAADAHRQCSTTMVPSERWRRRGGCCCCRSQGTPAVRTTHRSVQIRDVAVSAHHPQCDADNTPHGSMVTMNRYQTNGHPASSRRWRSHQLTEFPLPVHASDRGFLS
jgi:hypothetical protein